MPAVVAATAIDDLIDRALAEDIGPGDATTAAIVPRDRRTTAHMVVKSAGVLCGVDVAFAVFRRLDSSAICTRLAGDGDPIDRPPRTVATIEAGTGALLAGERTALNLVQRMSGIATLAHRYLEAVAGTGVEILDTRKTAPGLRELDKRAVACGGGTNHRHGLFDAILIKDNHIAVAGGVRPAVAAARRAGGLPVEVEVDSLEQLDEALAAAPDAVLLDNMDEARLRAAVARTAGRCRLEASGGITLDNVRSVAETGVDAISVGALTHSVIALDVSLEVC